MSDSTHEPAAAPYMEVATLAGGCFWCLEAVYEQVLGVMRVESGYSGGQAPHPSYLEVCTGATGHAETVQLTFDPQIVSYRGLLEIFFSIHDPTTLNRQGPDVGHHYRSAIFYHNADQKASVDELIVEFTALGLWDSAVVTEITPFTAFYPAEDYHKEYYRRNLDAPYCQIVIAPKLAKFREQHLAQLRR